MKFRFITIMHNLELEGLGQQVIKLCSNGIISNNRKILNETFNNDLSIGTLGIHSIDEFDNQPFFILDDIFEEDISGVDINKHGTRFTFALLRLVQKFTFDLWKLRDNNIYIRDGFLFVFSNRLQDGVTFKGSLSAITSFSNKNMGKSKFSEKELIQNSKIQDHISVKDLLFNNFNYKEATHDHFFKYSNSDRLDRAWYFVLNARSEPTLPMKIVSYCTALECLFTTGRSELIHRIAERVAILFESEQEGRIKIYNIVKKAYDIRSTIVHGAILKGTQEDLEEISFTIDNILRQLITKDYELFSKKDQDLDDYFLKQLFGSGTS